MHIPSGSHDALPGSFHASDPEAREANATPLGAAPAFVRALGAAYEVARTDVPVLIVGEPQTGKGTLARFIHQLSPRSTGPIVICDCAELPPTAAEAIVFGVRGGRGRDTPGEQSQLAAARGGTLILRNFISLPRMAQSRLAECLNDGKLGRSRESAGGPPVMARLVALSSRRPDDAVRAGDLREDLLRRLREHWIYLPPLRDRREDIQFLAESFLIAGWRQQRGTAVPAPRLSTDAVAALADRRWESNIGELRTMMYYVAETQLPGATVRAADLPPAPGTRPTPPATPSGEGARTADHPLAYHPARDRVIAEFELKYLHELVAYANGNMSEAARIAGVDRTTLYRLMERHGLQRTPQSGLVRTPIEPTQQVPGGNPPREMAHASPMTSVVG